MKFKPLLRIKSSDEFGVAEGFFESIDAAGRKMHYLRINLVDPENRFLPTGEIRLIPENDLEIAFS